MKRVLNADKIKIVDNGTPAFIDKGDYEALVILATAAAVKVEHDDVIAGTSKETYLEVTAEVGDHINVDLVGAKQFIKITNADAIVFGDKRDIHEVVPGQPDHQLHPHIDKDRNRGK